MIGRPSLLKSSDLLAYERARQSLTAVVRTYELRVELFCTQQHRRRSCLFVYGVRSMCACIYREATHLK